MGTFRSLSAGDVAEIMGLFGLAGAGTSKGTVTVTPIAAGTVNTNFAVDLPPAAPGATAERRFLRINEGKGRDDVVREAAIVEHVASRGVATPRPLHARDGQPFALWQDAFISLFPWVEGRTLARAEVGPVHAEAAGRALAELHRAGVDYGDHRPGRYEADEIETRMGNIARVHAPSDPVLARAAAQLGPTLAALRQERAADLPMGLIHGDLFIDNVLYRDGALTALLDFEQASWGRLVYDLAVSVLAFGFGREDFRADVTRAFIDGYRAVRPPAPAEARGFGAELRLAACRFAVTRITDVYLRRGEGAPAGKDFQRYLDRLVAVEKHLRAGSDLFALA
jgi:homoserine kinase type II